MQMAPPSRFRYFVDRVEYLNWLASDACQRARRTAEAPVAALLQSGGTQAFYCYAHCDAGRLLHVPEAVTETGYYWRESGVCSECGAITRIRLAAEWFHRAAINYRQPRIYLTEQLTPLYKSMRTFYPAITGSEFVPDADAQNAATLTLASYLEDPAATIRHEDVCSLSFANESFDLIGSFDVLEHVPDYAKALREFYRILAPGGQLLLTVPFLNASPHTLVRARIENGELRHLEKPEYHGNPTIDDCGILCFYHFGWDLLDALRNAGFSAVALLDAWGAETALFGDQLAIVATR